MEVLCEFQQLTLSWRLFNLSLLVDLYIPLFWRWSQIFWNNFCTWKGSWWGEVYRQLNEKPQIDRKLSFITGIHAFITCSDFRYNSNCACAAHLLPSQYQTLIGERYSDHSLIIHLHWFLLNFLRENGDFVIIYFHFVPYEVWSYLSVYNFSILVFRSFHIPVERLLKSFCPSVRPSVRV
jgi:hypothetical protein